MNFWLTCVGGIKPDIEMTVNKNSRCPDRGSGCFCSYLAEPLQQTVQILQLHARFGAQVLGPLAVALL